MKRRLGSIMMIVLALAVILGGCGSGNKGAANDSGSASPSVQPSSSPSASPSAPAARQKVSVLSWWDFTQSEPLQKLKSRFEELNPDLELEFSMVGGAEYADKVLSMVAGGGQLPDVIMLAMDKIPMFAEKGVILPLDSYAKPEYLNSLYPVVLEATSYNGKPYAVARDIATKVMFLNKKLFDDNQVAYPEANWTWDQFTEIAKKLSKPDGTQWGFYFPKFADGYTHWLMLNGGGYVTQDGKSLLGMSESKDMLQKLVDMINKDKVIPTESQAQQFGAADNASFIAGKTAMLAGALSYTGAFKTANVEYLIRPLPTITKQGTTSFVNAWAMPKGAKNPEISWRVMEYFSSKEGQQIVLDSGMGLPASKDVDTSAFLAQHPDNKYFIEALSYSSPFPSPIYGAAFNPEVQKQFDLMWLGQKSVEDSVAAVEKVAPDLLSGN